MLVIDSLVELFYVKSSAPSKVKIYMEASNRIALRFPELKGEEAIKREDLEFIQFQLTAFFGAMEINRESGTVYISFVDNI